MLLFLAGSKNETPAGSGLFLCRMCETWLTSASYLIEVMGRPCRRTYVNPHEIKCDIYTFGDCCDVLEHPHCTTEDTWFDGYAWRIIGCPGCGTHIGWKFEAQSAGLEIQGFYGLLTTSLKVRDVAPD